MEKKEKSKGIRKKYIHIYTKVMMMMMMMMNE